MAEKPSMGTSSNPGQQSGAQQPTVLSGLHYTDPAKFSGTTDYPGKDSGPASEESFGR